MAVVNLSIVRYLTVRSIVTQITRIRSIVFRDSQFANGVYRALSSFNVALSFGEFEAMILPLGYYFIAHSATNRDKILAFLTWRLVREEVSEQKAA